MLLIAEMEYGAISADMFYRSAKDVVRGRACPKKLLHLIYEFWKAWRDDADRPEWRIMTMVLDGGDDPMIRMQYPHEMDPEESMLEIRPREVAKVFGDTRIDFSGYHSD